MEGLFLFMRGTLTSLNQNLEIRNSFRNLQSVSEAILKAGVSKARLVLGIDLTASNEWQGRLTFSRNSLHKMHPVRSGNVYNPYQRVISIIGKTLHPFTEAGKVFAYGFGDVTTQDSSVFNITGEEGTACRDFKEVLVRYNDMLIGRAEWSNQLCPHHQEEHEACEGEWEQVPHPGHNCRWANGR
jgi:hypothetical protein